MEVLLTYNPFFKSDDIDSDKLYVTFLTEPPKQEHINKIGAVSYEPDKFIISGKEVYVYCLGGYGTTKLSNNFFENKLKITATTRNWRTVNELYKIMKS